MIALVVTPEGLPLAVHSYLARTPSRLLAVQLEDVLGVEEQANLPGTQWEYPNWRRKLPISLGAFPMNASFRDLTLQSCNHLTRFPNLPRYIWPNFLQYLCERQTD